MIQLPKNVIMGSARGSVSVLGKLKTTVMPAATVTMVIL